MQHTPISTAELSIRLRRLRTAMEEHDPAWKMIILDDKLNLYYLTGTMQDAILVITPKRATYFVRKDFNCALQESTLPDIRPINSFQDVASALREVPDTVYVSTRSLRLQKLQMLQKHLHFSNFLSIDPILSQLRAVKSAYELDCMRRAGMIHQHVMENLVPTMLTTGISEAKLCCEVYTALLERGATGIARYNNPMGEDVLGLCSFGENGLRRSAFDSPTGTAGTCFAMKSIGSSSRWLHNGDLVMLDIPSGFLGYHTDKSIFYFFGSLAKRRYGDKIRAARENCVEMEKEIANMLRPGALPSDIYRTILAHVDPAFRHGFMNGCKFVGHSIGLTMDETPVLAQGFDRPLEVGMTIAVEPKIALDSIGLVGTENTYEIVEKGPARSLTGQCDTKMEIGD